MTTPQATNARPPQYKQRLQRRQSVIFGFLLTVLLVIGGFSAAVVAGLVDSPFDRDFTRQSEGSPYSKIAPPCLPEGTNRVETQSVKVVVLNVTELERLGLGKAVRMELRNRGYEKAFAQNISAKEAVDTVRTQVRFGAAGIAQAYTVAENFESPLMLLDDRTDERVDVVVGAEFDTMVPTQEVIDRAGTPMTSANGCIPIDKSTPLPALPKGDTPAESPAQE